MHYENRVGKCRSILDRVSGEDRRLLEAHSYGHARELLLHRNPWTGLRYVEEPAIALIDLANENSVFLLDVWRKLDGPYLETYTKLWNAWLLRRYADQAEAESRLGQLSRSG